MKLKYYLRGMGIGIILTAIVMGFALGGRKATISDAEVIERAKALGMVDPTSGVLTQSSNGAGNNEANTIASGETLDKTGEEIPEEIDEGLTSNGESDSGLDEAAVEGAKKTESTETEETTSSSEASSTEESVKPEEDTAVSEEVKAEDAGTSNSEANDFKTDTTKKEEVSSDIKESIDNASNAKTTDSATENSSNEAPQNNTSGLGAKTSVTKTITIPGGLGSDQVAAILQREGIVDSAYSFNQYLCDNRMDRIIRSGTKTIPAGSTYQDIANIICK